MVLSKFAHYRSQGFEVYINNTGWTGVTGCGSEESVFCRVGSIRELIALRFLCLQATSVN